MTGRPDQPTTEDIPEVPTPFLFKVMVVLAVLYLGWRLIQGVAWLIAAIF
jgi:hypothetical protein